MVFIRAPFIEEVGPQVEVLASEGGRPVLVREGKMLVATFHPELTGDTTVHEYFLKLAAEPSPFRTGGFCCIGLRRRVFISTNRSVAWAEA